MTITKREIINKALDESGLNTFIHTANTSEQHKAFDYLERIGKQWDKYRFGYILGDPNDPDPDVESGIPDFAEDAFITELVIRLKKQYMPNEIDAMDIKQASYSFKNAYKMLGKTREVKRMSTMPKGKGNRSTLMQSNYYRGRDKEAISIINDTDLELD